MQWHIPLGLLLIKIYSSSYEKKESKNKNDNKLQEFQKEENGISLPSIQEGIKLQNILKLTSLCFLSTKSSLKVLHRNSIKQTSSCPNPNSWHHELNSLISPTSLYSASLFQLWHLHWPPKLGPRKQQIHVWLTIQTVNTLTMLKHMQDIHLIKAVDKSVN